MGNHRADRRGRKRPAGEQTPVVPSAERHVEYPAPYQPKRRADVPIDFVAPSAAVTSSATTPAAPIASASSAAPITPAATARGDGRGDRPAGGRRRAEPAPRQETPRREAPAPGRAARPAPKRRAQQASPLIRVPALPTVVGAVALLAAAGGAIGVGNGTLPGPAGLQLSAGSAASNLTGTDAIGLTERDSRAKAISRDADRRQRQDAADQDLKAVAEQQSQQRSAKLASLNASTDKRSDEIAKNLWVLPTFGYHITARFGWSSGLWSHGHTGLDFAAHVGTPIYAIAGGVITETGYDGAYGNKTVQTLPDGTEIWYCHQNAINVQVGEKVTQRQQIGQVGSTGNTTGPHLHIEVRPGGGDPVDPYPAFVYHGVTP